MNRRSGVYGASVDMIEAFKAQWPCHGFPDELACLVAYFDASGDLVDLDAFDGDGSPLDTHDFDGAALVALVSDVQERGYTARPDGAAMVAAIQAGKGWS